MSFNSIQPLNLAHSVGTFFIFFCLSSYDCNICLCLTTNICLRLPPISIFSLSSQMNCVFIACVYVAKKEGRGWQALVKVNLTYFRASKKQIHKIRIASSNKGMLNILADEEFVYDSWLCRDRSAYNLFICHKFLCQNWMYKFYLYSSIKRSFPAEVSQCLVN